MIRHYDDAPEDVKWYFRNFSELVEYYEWDVPISYVFSQVEKAKRMTLYCGIVKLHWCEASLTRRLIDREHLSRSRFIELFKVVFGKEIPGPLIKKLKNAEAVRDRAAHGSSDWTQADARKCLTDIVDFAAGFNQFVDNEAGFRPFGKLQGFKGRRTALPKATTRWVLMGMGVGR